MDDAGCGLMCGCIKTAYFPMISSKSLDVWQFFENMGDIPQNCWMWWPFFNTAYLLRKFPRRSGHFSTASGSTPHESLPSLDRVMLFSVLEFRDFSSPESGPEARPSTKGELFRPHRSRLHHRFAWPASRTLAIHCLRR
jgi:hypothetical protein